MIDFIRITVNEPGEASKEYLLGSSSSLKIGRDPSNDIVMKDAGVSRFHAVFIATGLACVVSDLFSRNGTFLNGTPIKRDAKIAPHDILNIGASKILVEFFQEQSIPDTLSSDSTSALPMARLLIAAFWLRPRELTGPKPGNWSPALSKNALTFAGTIVAERTETIVLGWELGNYQIMLAAMDASCRDPNSVRHQCFVWQVEAFKTHTETEQKFTFMADPADFALRLQPIIREMSVPIVLDKNAANTLSKNGIQCKHVMTVKVNGETEPATFFTLEQ